MTVIPREWLLRNGTPEDFEREELERKAKAFNLPFGKVALKFAAQPFGEMTERWRNFVQKIEPGDELWSFRSPEETFARKLRCQGHAIVRDSTIRDTFITLRS